MVQLLVSVLGSDRLQGYSLRLLLLVVLNALQLFNVCCSLPFGLLLQHYFSTILKLTLHVVLALCHVLQEALIIFELPQLSGLPCKDLLLLLWAIVRRSMKVLLLIVLSKAKLLLLVLRIELDIPNPLVELASAQLSIARSAVS